MSYITNKQDGFTLVEIAIVLVIIGVLLGGVLKGQELIKSAQVRNLIDQSSSIQAAYYGFVDRYHQIPGDMKGDAACKLIGNQVPNCVGGNGKRVIEKNNWKEASAVWAHLAAAGFIQGNYQGGATSEATYRDPAQAPANAFGGLLVLSRSDGYRTANPPAPEKLNLVLGRNLPVGIIQQLDVKVDEGLPTTGTVRATAGDSFGQIGQGDPACVTEEGAPPVWNINGGSSDCNAAVLY
jgi:prepilin-type N-terminal cleavage/methylation domain-containing protein